MRPYVSEFYFENLEAKNAFTLSETKNNNLAFY